MIDFSCKRFSLDEIIKCALGLTKTEVRIFLLLQKEQVYLTSKEISHKFDIDITTAQKLLKKLAEHEVIEKRQENLSGGGYQFVYKLKSKKYVSEYIMQKVNTWTSYVKKELCL